MPDDLTPEQRFAARTRELRQRSALTQPQLADAVHAAGGPRLDPSNLARLEKGQRRITLDEAVVIAAVLDSTVADMTAVEPGPDDVARLAEIAAAERAVAEAQARLWRARGSRVVGAQPMSEAEHRAAADQADEIESVGGEVKYRRLLDEQSEG